MPSSAASLPKVLFITGNANKLKEVREILAAGTSFGALPFELDSRSLDLPEIQGTTQEVALAKVKAAAEQVQGPVFTEDTALCFDALDGLPGPYIKDFMTRIGHSGLNAMLAGFSTTSATAVCTFGYSSGLPGSTPLTFEGTTRGRIVAARGSKQFGWDPVFEPEESGGLTYAEMKSEDKNAISHRFRALDKLREHLVAQFADAGKA